MNENWDINKENIEPLKRGRDANCLAKSLNYYLPENLEKKLELILEKHKYENELKASEIDVNYVDPLNAWYRYIDWFEQSAFATNCLEIINLLEQATFKFVNVEKYNNDDRYISLWQRLIQFYDDKLDAINYMFSKNIGKKRYLFYSILIEIYQKMREYKLALQVAYRAEREQAEPKEIVQQILIKCKKDANVTSIDKPKNVDIKIKASIFSSSKKAYTLDNDANKFNIYKDENVDPDSVSHVLNENAKWTHAPNYISDNVENRVVHEKFKFNNNSKPNTTDTNDKDLNIFVDNTEKCADDSSPKPHKKVKSVFRKHKESNYAFNQSIFVMPKILSTKTPVLAIQNLFLNMANQDFCLIEIRALAYQIYSMRNC
ncbi:hypothetical protein A3Q56_03719 [Intoshia linei]|uniref:BUB1 N-terminal domain-containing protein n=1 Tax=Intoshia linei TaxID=1819745 RepID=A0A177B2N4_9BILA|nr:hypothetical protein A3Q56_03719 [Intoshia linei]